MLIMVDILLIISRLYKIAYRKPCTTHIQQFLLIGEGLLRVIFMT